MLYVLVSTGPNDGTALVSSLQSLLVYEEFYSIKTCTINGLLGVSLLLPSVTSIQYSLKRQTEMRMLQWAYCWQSGSGSGSEVEDLRGRLFNKSGMI